DAGVGERDRFVDAGECCRVPREISSVFCMVQISSTDAVSGTLSRATHVASARCPLRRTGRDYAPIVRRSIRTVATHEHPKQAPMLAVIVIEAGFMQRG